jgi:hypothetical protein
MQVRVQMDIGELLPGVKVFAEGLAPGHPIELSFVRARAKPEARMNMDHRVGLRRTGRDELKAVLSGGRHAAGKLKRAQILLAADAGAGDEEFARKRDHLPDQAPLGDGQPGGGARPSRSIRSGV